MLEELNGDCTWGSCITVNFYPPRGCVHLSFFPATEAALSVRILLVLREVDGSGLGEGAEDGERDDAGVCY